MPYSDEYDYDFDHPACLKYGDKLMKFMIVAIDNDYGIKNDTHSIGEMEFVSQSLADAYCTEMSLGGFYWYQALPLNEEK